MLHQNPSSLVVALSLMVASWSARRVPKMQKPLIDGSAAEAFVSLRPMGR